MWPSGCRRRRSWSRGRWERRRARRLARRRSAPAFSRVGEAPSAALRPAAWPAAEDGGAPFRSRLQSAPMASALSALALAAALATPQQLARDIYKELIEINTTDASGDNTRAAEAMAARLRAAGFAAEDV